MIRMREVSSKLFRQQGRFVGGIRPGASHPKRLVFRRATV
jgi:hypothetical protein